MKKIFVFVIVFMLAFTPKVSALTYFENVTVNTSFAEEIDVNAINSIEICLEDSTQEEKMYTLKQEENFSLSLTNIIAGNLKFDYGLIENDRTGIYKVTGNVNISADYKTAVVNVLVENQNYPKQDVIIPDAALDIIYEKKTTTPVVSTTTAIDSGSTESEDITKRTTTTSNKDDEEIEKEKEKQRKENRKKNDIIGIVLLSILGIIVLIGLLIAIVKISKANK